MKMSKLIGRRDKNNPKEAQIPSHQLLLRGGYIRQVGTGLYSLLPLGLRVVQKIEAIIREEMNAIGTQEVLMPVVVPKELWEESGRYDSVGSELLRFSDRTGKKYVLSMTHEEPAVHLARSEIFSYKQLPCSIYHIQTKFRDEPRARGGLIRVREFTMKDAYSFHENEECLDKTYQDMYQAYEKIYQRTGLKKFLSVEADTGMMGGGLSHEFMSVSEVGEDSFLTCKQCEYRANMEVAQCIYPEYEEQEQEHELVATPNTQSIDDVSALLKVETWQTSKAVFYKDAEGKLVYVLTRGDLEVNEAKLKSVIGTPDLEMANDELITANNMLPGYASPLGTDTTQYRLFIDNSLKGRKNLVTGANKDHSHFLGFYPERDLEGMEYEWVDVTNVKDQSTCPDCKEGKLELLRGVEIGNIFKLGEKYSKSMQMTYLDSNGKAQTPIMGCYGIGVGRLMACIIEEHHDDYGPIWPESVAPYQVQINVLDPKKEGVLDAANTIYDALQSEGIEILMDDRGEKAGFQFGDADLLGLPHRLVISPKNLKDNAVEYRTRACRDSEKIQLDQVVSFIVDKLKA